MRMPDQEPGGSRSDRPFPSKLPWGESRNRPKKSRPKAAFFRQNELLRSARGVSRCCSRSRCVSCWSWSGRCRCRSWRDNNGSRCRCFFFFATGSQSDGSNDSGQNEGLVHFERSLMNEKKLFWNCQEHQLLIRFPDRAGLASPVFPINSICGFPRAYKP